ncbi:hypothetical protein P8C59_005508 [Phyllachora maydis]|uniref:ATP-dependent RNA helicase n=2 Tax=Phyllachora maydis TaxID=1825666 RepID=A0AAD9I500_9PEZI|nr:hypothetical protein P8C59_005508 [Phyllachora maydis]
MADDGMLLNFEIGDAPLQSQVKFKGGKWRDRVRAQKSVKRWQAKPTATESAATSESRATAAADALHRSERPAKRQRLDGRARSGNVTSRLFSSIPLPITAMDGAPAEAAEAEAAEPSNAPLSSEAETFLALGLSGRIAQHLSSKLEMRAPTSIQKNTIPQLIKEDSDAFLQAETGSGKTLAYLLPIVQRILALSLNDDGTTKDVKIHRNSGLFALILGPTRELCKQIATVAEKVFRCAPWLVSTTVIGGESKKSEKARIRKGINILIATPGRLADHLANTKVLDVGTVRWLVLDEGDRMMEMGFEEDLRTIVSKIRQNPLCSTNSEGVQLDGVLPSRRVTILCSATMKMSVQKLGEISLEDATHITSSRPDGGKEADIGVVETVFAAPSQLKQSYILVPAKLRLVTLVALLKSTFARKGSVMKAIIFISCADSVNFHFDLLKSPVSVEPRLSETPAKRMLSPSTDGTVAPASYVTSPANPQVVLHKLHGSLPQPVRTATLQSFTTCNDPCVLITTDISSRGLDVPAVDLVVEYDPAFAVADHVHRVGRTARAGRPGKAVLFLQPGCEEAYISLLHPTSPPAPQLYDSVLQKGFASAVHLPTPADEEEAGTSERQTWKDRAEALQLHLEQRLLATAPTTEETAGDPPKKSFRAAKDGQGARWPAKPKDSALLDSSRNAFRSHIRAYATHVKEERECFDISQLHLGHVAKSFGLREAPGGIGGGVSRRTHKGPPGGSTPQQKGGAGGRKRPAAGSDEGVPGVGSAMDDVAVVDDAAVKRMKAKMKAVMNASSEFNIG